MNYIFFDLEFNRPIGRIHSKLSFEIMEIGAVKTDENLNIIDTFRIYVRNRVYRSINRYVTKLTGITLKDLESGVNFDKAYKIFRQWIGKEEFKVCSYSDSDQRVLDDNLKYNNIYNKRFQEVIDIQGEIMCKMNMSRQPSLKDLCYIYGVEVDESQVHKSLTDAMLLAKVYKEFLSCPLSVVEMRNHVDDKYKDLFDLTKKITFDEAKKLDKRKYKVICPSCKKPLVKDNIYYHSTSGNIHVFSSCKRCDKRVAVIFKIRKHLITEEYMLLKATYKDKLYKDNTKYIIIK